ncbi:unnamed protein product [Pylaiella littoralis]
MPEFLSYNKIRRVVTWRTGRQWRSTTLAADNSYQSQERDTSYFV